MTKAAGATTATNVDEATVKKILKEAMEEQNKENPPSKISTYSRGGHNSLEDVMESTKTDTSFGVVSHSFFAGVCFVFWLAVA